MGLLLALVARAMVVSSQLLLPAVKHAWRQFAPDIEYLGTAVIAALLGCLLPYPINWILRWRGRLADLQYHAIVLHGNLLLRLFHTASRERRLVSITLERRSWKSVQP